jgi:hypothetical protein
MATLQYQGQSNSGSSPTILATKTYADAGVAGAIVTDVGTGFNAVSTLIRNSVLACEPASYVTGVNATLPTQAAVTAADTGYIARARLNAAAAGTVPGIAGLDASGLLITTPTSQIPSGVSTERLGMGYSVGLTTGNIMGGTASTVTKAIGVSTLTSGSVHTVTGTGTFILATISIPDPGFPFLVLPFGWVEGDASSGPAFTLPQNGNGCYGLLTVQDPGSGLIYGGGVCASDSQTNLYPIFPDVFPGQSLAPLTAASAGGPTHELELIASASGSGTVSYNFYGTDMSFWCFIVPSL